MTWICFCGTEVMDGIDCPCCGEYYEQGQNATEDDWEEPEKEEVKKK